MKQGGNQVCNDYLQKHGIGPRTPIKQKYESPVAQLYKEVLKARVEGRPEPTELPKPQVQQSPSTGGSFGSVNSSNNAADANGMERLPGESEQQYIARQTRLRDDAKARMAAKFGSGGMGGVGSSASGGRMQGIGSDSSYNPNSGGYRNSNSGGGGDFDVNSLVSGFGSVLGSAMNTAKSLADEQTVNTIRSTGASFWGGLTSTVSSVAASIANPDEGSDGLADLQRQVAAQKPSSSIYGGFGSDQSFPPKSSLNDSRQKSSGSLSGSFGGGFNGGSTAGGVMQEAQGMPGEDRNGVERLTGESEEQYIMRQTRLRDEARARMAAKFGGGGLSSSATSAVSPAPGSGNLGRFSTNSMSSNGVIQSAPTSGNAGGTSFATSKTPTPKKVMNSNDFFSSFGE